MSSLTLHLPWIRLGGFRRFHRASLTIEPIITPGRSETWRHGEEIITSFRGPDRLESFEIKFTPEHSAAAILKRGRMKLEVWNDDTSNPDPEGGWIYWVFPRIRWEFDQDNPFGEPTLIGVTEEGRVRKNDWLPQNLRGQGAWCKTINGPPVPPLELLHRHGWLGPNESS